MIILLSNDDGVRAPGLHQFADQLRKLGKVFICAPDRVRSGASSALTINEPVMAEEVGPGCWSVSGTPTDAVKLALNELMDRPPDIVVSGINNGLNTGCNVLYSGTVAAALEGVQSGITSFAVSRKFAADEDYREQSRVAARLLARVAKKHPSTRTVFNMNVPPGEPRGVQVTTTELAPYDDKYQRRVDPRGREYYWICGQPARKLRRNGRPTDDWAIERGWVTVTPLRRDLTDPSLLGGLDHILRDS